MSERALIVTDATPSATGAADWRRAAMLSGFYRDGGFETAGLCILPDGSMAGRGGVAAMRGAFDRWAFAGKAEAARATALLTHRFGFAATHVCGLADTAAVAEARAVEVRDAGAGGGAEGAEIRVGFEPRQADEGAIAAPLLRLSRRLTRGRIAPGARILAGCWVEEDERSVAAARALFRAIAEKGGGYGPNFALAGPGAGRVRPPRLPNPPTIMPPSVTERVFYRAVDIALFPDAPIGATGHLPRYEILSALECGATPMVSDSALIGLRDHWRLPRFAALEHLAEYLFEEGRALREGGLMAELRARADWTWSGLSGAAAAQRARLMQAVRDKIAERRKG